MIYLDQAEVVSTFADIKPAVSKFQAGSMGFLLDCVELGVGDLYEELVEADPSKPGLLLATFQEAGVLENFSLGAGKKVDNYDEDVGFHYDSHAGYSLHDLAVAYATEGRIGWTGLPYVEGFGQFWSHANSAGFVTARNAILSLTTGNMEKMKRLEELYEGRRGLHAFVGRHLAIVFPLLGPHGVVHDFRTLAAPRYSKTLVAPFNFPAPD